MTKGHRIKTLRDNAGYSQVELADKIGVSKQTLYKYENDIITNIPSDKIELIAEYTHSTPAYIMGWNYPDATASELILTDPEEKEIIYRYRAADDLDRAIVKRTLGMDERQKGDGQVVGSLVS